MDAATDVVGVTEGVLLPIPLSDDSVGLGEMVAVLDGLGELPGVMV